MCARRSVDQAWFAAADVRGAASAAAAAAGRRRCVPVNCSAHIGAVSEMAVQPFETPGNPQPAGRMSHDRAVNAMVLAAGLGLEPPPPPTTGLPPPPTTTTTPPAPPKSIDCGDFARNYYFKEMVKAGCYYYFKEMVKAGCYCYFKEMVKAGWHTRTCSGSHSLVVTCAGTAAALLPAPPCPR